MKIFAAGIATETNTFCPIPTVLEDYQVQRGSEVLAGRVTYPSLDLSRLWGQRAKEEQADFIFSLMAWAEPSGITSQATYEALRDEILTDLALSLPVDIVLLNLHGAMLATGYEDCERDIIERVRQIVGAETVIAVELDLHCHLSEAKIAKADLVVTYKEYPHTDVNERAHELFSLAMDVHYKRIRPTMALFDCRMIGMYPTNRAPLRDFVNAMQEAERSGQALSISFGHGFQFADLPHVGAKVLVITDSDRDAAETLAHRFGRRIYAQRQEIGFDAISQPMDIALQKAIALTRGPVVVADQSDNTGGGAPGDSTYALRWLLDRGVENAGVAIFYDPEVVRICKRAGPGASLSVRLGGKLGVSSGDPLDLQVTVTAGRDDYFHAHPQVSGNPRLYPLGDVVALRCGTIDIVVASQRCQCFSPAVFTDLGICVNDKHLLVIKSAQHFYNAFSGLASEIIYMSAPGAVPPDPRVLAYTRLRTSRLYPWTEDPMIANPDT